MYSSSHALFSTLLSPPLQVNPASIVDKVIHFWLDLVTPGRGAGTSSWFQRQFRNLEQTSERASREMDIRSNLREWDRDHPEIHHEMLVRYVCGAVVSIVATSFYNSLRRGGRGDHGYRRSHY